MLFYERADALEPVTMMEEIVASAPKEAASIASSIPVPKVSTQTSPVANEASCKQTLPLCLTFRHLYNSELGMAVFFHESALA